MNLALKSEAANENRSTLLDQLRGIAVALMIFFHASYDLSLFNFIEIDPFQNPFWFGLPRLIVFLFLLCVGIGLRNSHQEKIAWRKFWQRFIKLSLCAAVVSLSTYYMFPTRWIYFGTLHCIALCSLLALPWLRAPILAILTATIIVLLEYFGYGIPWIKMAHASMDYIPAFPWIAVVFLGFFLHHLGLHQQKIPRNKYLEFLGRHSLVIYLLHQPLLFGLIKGVSALIRS